MHRRGTGGGNRTVFHTILNAIFNGKSDGHLPMVKGYPAIVPRRPQGALKVPSRRPQGALKAPSRRPQCALKAPSRRPQGALKAPSRHPQGALKDPWRYVEHRAAAVQAPYVSIAMLNFPGRLSHGDCASHPFGYKYKYRDSCLAYRNLIV